MTDLSTRAEQAKPEEAKPEEAKELRRLARGWAVFRPRSNEA